MEKIKKYIPRIILLDTIIYTLIIVTLYLILSFCKLMFREWIYIVSTIIIMFGFIVRIMQLLLKIKKNVNYYDYKNIFVVGNQKRIEEYYGKGGFDPIENQYGYEYNVENTTYYDENGKIIKTKP